MNGRLNFRMRGPFRVTAPDGRDLTPRLAKAQGLLLLLLAGRDGARGRAWVQDRLWSDRAPEQGAASLRQALWAIRTEFGPYRDVLHADRSKVWLDMGRVSVDDEGSEDFAEGLDIRDPEFDEWLAGQRARTSEDAPDAGTRPAPPALTMGRPATAGPGADPERIGITCLSDGSEVAKWTAGYVGDCLYRCLAGYSHADVVRRTADDPVPDVSCDVDLELHCIRVDAATLAIRLAALADGSRRQLFSGDARVTLRGGPPVDDLAIGQLIHRVVEALAVDRQTDRACPDSDDPDALLGLAIKYMYSMRHDRIAEADRLLKDAFEIRPMPLYQAWRLQLRTIQRLERVGPDENALRDEGEMFAAYALEGDPTNSMILALLANAHLFLFRSPDTSLEYARNSVEQNPGNAMAVFARSSARLYTGDIRGGYQDALQSRHLVRHSPRRFFVDGQLAGSAMLLGKLGEAKQLFRSAALQCPSYRPALRYLVALSASDGSVESAIGYARTLSRLEDGFSVERLMMDRDYPASLVHQTDLIDSSRVLAIA